MSYAEFIEWHAFAQIEPLPEARADLRNALMMLLQAKVSQGKKQKKIKLETFLPDWWNAKRDPRRLAAKFRALTAHLDEANQEEPQPRRVRGAEVIEAEVPTRRQRDGIGS